MSDFDDAPAWDVDEDPGAWSEVQPPAGADPEDPLAQVTARVENVETLLADIIDLLESRGGKSRWSWATLGDEERAWLWQELAQFVAYLEDRYLIHLDKQKWQIPSCWYLHPVAVEELTALMVAHKATYGPQASKPSPQLVEFHERSLWPTLSRLYELKVYTACTKDAGHQDDTAYRRRPWSPDEDFNDFLKTEGAHDEQA